MRKFSTWFTLAFIAVLLVLPSAQDIISSVVIDHVVVATSISGCFLSLADLLMSYADVCKKGIKTCEPKVKTVMKHCKEVISRLDNDIDTIIIEDAYDQKTYNDMIRARKRLKRVLEKQGGEKTQHESIQARV